MALMGYRQYAAYRKAKGLKGGSLAAVQKGNKVRPDCGDGGRPD